MSEYIKAYRLDHFEAYFLFAASTLWGWYGAFAWLTRQPPHACRGS